MAQTFACPVCGLRYPSRAVAQRCETWCRAHRSCNLAIAKHAVKK